MGGLFSRDCYRSIADLSAKRSDKAKRKCADCGNDVFTRGGRQTRCRPCAAEHTVFRMRENSKASKQRARDRQRKELV